MATKVTHVIFDCGGTLVDTFTRVKEVIDELAKQNDRSISRELYSDLAEMESMSDELQSFLEKLDIDIKDLNETFDELLKRLLKRYLSKPLKLKPGAERLVRHLYEINISMAIATNMSNKMFETITRNVEGFDIKLFSHIVCGADDPEVKTNKPAPDVYLVCAKRFVRPPVHQDNCIIFEDSLTGLKSAVGSGMKSVVLRNEFSADLNEFEDRILAQINTFEDFNPESVGLPQY